MRKVVLYELLSLDGPAWKARRPTRDERRSPTPWRQRLPRWQSSIRKADARTTSTRPLRASRALNAGVLLPASGCLRVL